MTYSELKEVMHEYRMGRINKTEMACAVALWQLKNYGQIGE